MSKEYYTENLSIETLAKLTDEMLRFEKKKKNKGIKINMNIIGKTAPIVAAFALVIGLMYSTNISSNINTDKINPATNINEKNTMESTAINPESDDDISPQIGDLKIITPKGQEPIQNDDGTITLPGGGSYTNPYNGDKIIAPSGTIITNNGSNFGAYNTNEQIKIEQADGQQFWGNYYNCRFNTDDEVEESEDIQEEIAEELNNQPRLTVNVNSHDEIEVIYKFNDKTKIITDYYVTTVDKKDGGYYIKINKNINICTIKLTNGVIIDAPFNTKINFNENGELTIITVGNSDAVIIQPDGIEITVSKGTVLDSEGNVIS